jgi:histidinol-phosphate aminotransferase
MRRYEAFAKDRGIEYIESYTNFITYILPHQYESSQICDTLLKQGIIVRNLKSYGLNAIRITIGKREQNDRFFAAFEQLVG